MDQAFTIGNFKLIEDRDGFAILQKQEDSNWLAVATFIVGAEALVYFNEKVFQAQLINRN